MGAADRASESFGKACDISERGSLSSLDYRSRASFPGEGNWHSGREFLIAGRYPLEPSELQRSSSSGAQPRRNQGMALEYIIRFLLGGVVVSAFALLGDVLRPKSFAGLFGAAPSVALATLGITLLTKGGQYAAVEGRSMIIGSLALAAYSFLVCQLLIRFRSTALAASVPAVIAWLAVALGFRYALLGA